MWCKSISHCCVAAVCASLLGACGPSSSGGTAGGAAQGSRQAASSSGPVDACALFSAADLAAIVGNPVQPGQPFAGQEVCKWDAEPGHVTVLLTVRRTGSEREKVLCADLGKSADSGQRIDGVGRIATWKFSNTMGLFNSGDLETCGDDGYVSVTLNGKQDEVKLKDASIAVARKVFETL